LRHAGGTLNGFDLATLDGASPAGAAAALTRATECQVSAAAIAEALHVALETGPVRAMPGAPELLEALAHARLPVAVASNAPESAIRTALSHAGLDLYVPTIVSAETSGIFKPDPDVYRRACRQLGVAPCDALGFEDSAIGARAARSAGLTVVVAPVDPATRPYADLAVGSLADTRVLEMLGLKTASAPYCRAPGTSSRGGRAPG
jgi:HAD superfamily hydrolase (TIGR01509 family)